MFPLGWLMIRAINTIAKKGAKKPAILQTQWPLEASFVKNQLAPSEAFPSDSLDDGLEAQPLMGTGKPMVPKLDFFFTTPLSQSGTASFTWVMFGLFLKKKIKGWFLGEASFQWLFLVPLKGGRDYIIPQLAVYTTYIPLIYCLLGGYIIPTIF